MRRCQEGVVGFFDTSGGTTAALLVLLLSLLLWMLLRYYVFRFSCDCSCCCSFFAALLLLLLLHCLSPGLPEFEGVLQPCRNSESARPPCLEPSCPGLTLDRPALDRSSPDHPKCRGFLFSLPRKQIRFFSSLLVPFTFSSLLLGVLTNLGSLGPLVKTRRLPPPKPQGLHKMTQRTPNLHFERHHSLQTSPNSTRRHRERKQTKKTAREERKAKF